MNCLSNLSRRVVIKATWRFFILSKFVVRVIKFLCMKIIFDFGKNFNIIKNILPPGKKVQHHDFLSLGLGRQKILVFFLFLNKKYQR